VVGEPGVGKSRLFWEFLRAPRPQPWLVLESTSVSYGKATAYRSVIDLLRAYFQIDARDDARRVRDKVVGKVPSLDRALEAALPPLLSLLDIALDDPAWAGLDPHLRRTRTLEGSRRLLLREAQVQPLLLVFEDLQWIDSETQALLDRLVDSLPGARLLLLVNYRREYEHGWGSRACRPPSSCTRPHGSPTPSTPSGTRSRTNWPTAACRRNAAEYCTRASCRPSSASTRAASMSMSKPWRSTHSGASCGTRRRAIWRRPRPRRSRARPTAKR
jgi:hypothetical protein